MIPWQLETTADFDKDLKKLDKPVRRRVAAVLEEIIDLEDPRVRGKGLTGNLAGYWRYRVGDYRVLAHIQDERFTVIAIGVAHRSSVYRG